MADKVLAKEQNIILALVLGGKRGEPCRKCQLKLFKALERKRLGNPTRRK